MYILLPPFITGKHGFNSMVSRVNGSLLHEAFENMWRTQVEVIIPKFKMEQVLENELIQVRDSGSSEINTIYTLVWSIFTYH